MSDLKIGDKFKALEKENEIKLDPNKYTIFRVDGKNFSDFTKAFAFPFDSMFRYCLTKAFKNVAEQLFAGPQLLCLYAQSDECSYVLPPIISEKQDFIFSGRVIKIMTVFTSKLASNYWQVLYESCKRYGYEPVKTYGMETMKNYKKSKLNPDKGIESICDYLGFKLPAFDMRFVQVNNLVDINDYMAFRRIDAIRNSKMQYARGVLSHKQTLNKTSGQIVDELLELGFDWKFLPDYLKRGVFLPFNEDCPRFDFRDDDEDTKKFIELLRG